MHFNPRGSARGFKLESLLRLAEIKSSPGALEALWAAHAAQSSNSSNAGSTTHSGSSNTVSSSHSGTAASAHSNSSRRSSGDASAHSNSSNSGNANGSTIGAVGKVGGPPRTSLLHYVVRSALRGASDSSSAAITALPQQLAGVRGAAGIQVSGIAGLISELKGGFVLLQVRGCLLIDADRVDKWTVI